jgi:hypothetical protein
LKNYDKGGNCAYCGKYSNPLTRDHVIAQTFYSKEDNVQNPIIVPACKPCNSGKSNEEDYTAIIMCLASGKELTKEQERGFKHFDKKRQQLFLNAKRRWIKINGVYQDMAIPELDHTALDKVAEYMAMGLVYEFCGKEPVMKKFNNRIVAWLPLPEENFVSHILSLKTAPLYEKFFDEDKFNNKIKYGIVSYDRSKILVYLQILNPLMFKDNREQCRIAAVSFLKEKS